MSVRIWISMSVGAATGLMLAQGCRYTEPNPLHCNNNEGDAYCAERFPDGSRPFCEYGAGSCFSGEDQIDGCVAERPVDSCYAPCGGRSTIEDDDECLVGGESSSGSSTSGGMTGETGSTTDGSSTTTGDVPCMGNEDCMDPAAPFCDPEGACVDCSGMPDGNAACAEVDVDRGVCDAGECVQCNDQNPQACGGGTPWCGEDRLCQPCTEHWMCPGSACHLDGEDVGSCFDLKTSTVVMAADTMALEGAFNGAQAGDDVLVLLTGSDYNGLVVDFTADAEVAVIGDGSQIISGNSGFAVIGVSAGIVYFSDLAIGPNGLGNGLACSGTSVWLDDSQLNGNNGAGLDVSGGCAAHLRRSVVRANDSGGIVAASSPVYLVDSAVGENVDTQDVAGIQLTNGELWMTYSSVVANLAVAGAVDSIQCFGTPSGEVRNSVVLATSGSSIATDCDGIAWSSNALDTADLDTVNGMAMSYDAAWFDPAEGDYHLTTAGSTELAGLASWQDGDPVTDIDGDLIPTDMPSHPGYDQP